MRHPEEPQSRARAGQTLTNIKRRGCHFGQKVDLGGKNTFYSQSVLHQFLSISQFLDFSNLILNSYFEVKL